ncbi:LamG-like jellyroll fold domain-containing protein [Aliikangiella coralliicola]|uniref:OmpR/PhoB-type domain-containing protein n=1 Tax=Aliikangiella coralliicola TaxID=2592383 RepID=A0A545UC48_9GAMM|nr:LamG-like jellyroll fold domain-containing protein [Aliikangiella coralliicola]TQV87039.1 hypothetical protein FLL46_14635 [Aliikangiella coralliicola]
MIDPKLNRAIYQGVVHSLEPRVMAVLVVLIENAGQLVLREEIIARVWRNQAVSDSSLNRNIAKLRKLLDVKGGSQSSIKTVTKKGYLLQADVIIVDEVPAADKATKVVSEEAKVSQETTVSERHQSIELRELTPAPDKSKVADLQSSKNPVSYLSNPKKDNNSRLHLLIQKKYSLLVLLVFSVGVVTFYFVNQYQLIQHYGLVEQSPPSDKKADYLLSTNNYKVVHNMTFAPHEADKAFCLDGVDDFVEIIDATVDIGRGDFSMSAWIKTSTEDTVVVIDKRNESYQGDVRGFNLHLLKGKVGVQLADGKGEWRCTLDAEKSSCTNFNSDAYVADNQWHFIVATIDRDDPEGLKFFVDGAFVESQDPTIRSGSLTTPKRMRIGSRSSSYSALFPGSIGEIKIRSGLWSIEEIQGQYAKGIQRDCRKAAR